MEDEQEAYRSPEYESMARSLKPRKYDIPRRSLVDQQGEKQGRKFFVYPNDDTSCKPFQSTFSSKKHQTLNAICDDIERQQAAVNSNIRTPKIRSVCRIFKWPSGEEVFKVYDILEDEETNTLVYSDKRKLNMRVMQSTIDGKEFGGRKSDNSRGSQKTSPTLRTSQGSMQSTHSPINIKVTSNTNPKSNCSVFINPKTTQDFQAILENITEMLKMTDPPCVALYPLRQRKVKVDSMSRFKLLNPRNGDEFIACGSDGPPAPPEKKERNGMANGNSQQSNNYQDQKGRSYQRHNGNRRSQTEDEDPSPTSRSPRRGGDTYREKGDGAYGKGKTTPRQQEQQNGHAHYNDDGNDNDMHDRHSNGNDGDDTRDNRSVSSRGSSPTGSVMNKRIDDMNGTRGDLDRDIDY